MMTIFVKAEVIREQIKLQLKYCKGDDQHMNRLSTLDSMFSYINIDEKVAVDEELFKFLQM